VKQLCVIFHCFNIVLEIASFLLWSTCAGSSVELEAKGDRSDITEHPRNDDRMLCNKRFKTKKHLSTRRNLHVAESSYSCSECKKRFLSPQNRCDHVNIHTAKYKCTECGKCCKSSAKLTIHRRSHSGEKPFECTVCGKRFVESGHLKVHHRIHSGEKPFECTVCGKRFAHSGDLVRHNRIHSGEKPFECTVCGKRFARSGHLLEHNRIHSGEKPFECTVCDKRFAWSGGLAKHNIIHSGEKPFECTCGKRFARSDHLVSHKRIHNGEKVFECTVCDKRFVEFSSLKVHSRIHLKKHLLRHEDVKPYTGSEYPSQVHAAAALKSNSTVHSGFKQFCCGKCGKYFKYKNTVIQHFERCTDDRLGIISLFKPRVSQ